MAYPRIILFIILYGIQGILQGCDDKEYHHLRHRHWKDGHRDHENRYHWTDWSGWSDCSRSCGTGVQFKERDCVKHRISAVVNASLCHGKYRHYRTCNTQKCSRNSFDFRAQQCSYYNKRYFGGKRYIWKPYTQELGRSIHYDPCALICYTRVGHEIIVRRLSHHVIDGTSCRKEDNHICINSECVPVGCDGELYSTKTIDECGICGGNGSGCERIIGLFNETNLKYGFYSLVQIPKGARELNVTELTKNSNINLAVGSKNGGLIFSGPTNVYSDIQHNISGSIFHFQRSKPTGHMTISANGPLNESVRIMILVQEEGVAVNISYEYILQDMISSIEPATESPFQTPSIIEKQPPIYMKADLFDGQGFSLKERVLTNTSYTANDMDNQDSTMSEHDDQDTYPGYPAAQEGTDNKYKNQFQVARFTYRWRTNGFAPCSATCSTGVQTSYIECLRSDNLVVDDSFCEDKSKPEVTHQYCEGRPCQARWVSGIWSQCSVSCGQGEQYRSVRCWRMMAPGFDSSVHDYMCHEKDKPRTLRPCRENACGPQWQVSDWSECSAKCGHGIQTREVRCSIAEQWCDKTTKPVKERPCSLGPCINQWTVSKWTDCSGPCGTGFQRRSVTCRSSDGTYLSEQMCDQNTRPVSVQACGDQPNCAPLWVPQEWGQCTAKCGQGVQTRRVLCGGVKQKEFSLYSEGECQHVPRPASVAMCNESPCEPQWFTTQWSQCSKTCGEGIRLREVTCYRNNSTATGCDLAIKPPTTEICKVPDCPSDISDACTDNASANCALVLRVKLCNHWYYKKACCRSCSAADP